MVCSPRGQKQLKRYSAKQALTQRFRRWFIMAGMSLLDNQMTKKVVSKHATQVSG